MTENNTRKKMTVRRFVARKEKGEKLAVLTAYDYFTARILDAVGVDALLVGDSVGMVLYGEKSTLKVTMEMMLAHCTAVARGAEYALVIADMPFMSYQPSLETAVINAGRFIKESGVQAVKLEGGIEMASTVKRIVECGIPVMGHIGLTPQSINRFGTARVQGRTDESAQYLMESAQALEEAGAFSMVLELVEARVAGDISQRVKIPTIGIGSGPHCDGQVLVINDILGLYPDLQAKFVRQYANLTPIIEKAARGFVADVKSGNYPKEGEWF